MCWWGGGGKVTEVLLVTKSFGFISREHIVVGRRRKSYGRVLRDQSFGLIPRILCRLAGDGRLSEGLWTELLERLLCLSGTRAGRLETKGLLVPAAMA